MRCILKGPEVHKFRTDTESHLICFLQTKQNKSISKNGTKSAKIFFSQSDWWDIKGIRST